MEWKDFNFRRRGGGYYPICYVSLPIGMLVLGERQKKNGAIECYVASLQIMDEDIAETPLAIAEIDSLKQSAVKWCKDFFQENIDELE